MNKQPFIIDERAVAVADKSCRFAWMVLAFGVMIIVVVRGLAFGQVCWDLLGLTFVSSVVGMIYQRVKHVQTLPRVWVLWLVGISAVIGAVISIAIAMAVKR